MRALLQLVCFILIPGYIFGQSFSFPKFNKPIKSARELLFPKWMLKDSAIGDLSGDHWPDMALVLEYADTVAELRSDSIENTGKPRILLILFWDTKARSYHVAAQNNTFILREGEGGLQPDPYGGISINNGVLEIYYQFVRESLSYKFRFRSPAIYLIGASDGGVSGEKFESWDFNFSTGWAKHEWRDSLNEKNHEQVEWKKITLRVPIRLKDMKFVYELEIFPSVFI